MMARQLTVVIADNDANILAQVAIAVRSAGMRLLGSASTGTTALEEIRKHQPDIALLDVSMPGLTGLEVTRAMRADGNLDQATVFLFSDAVDEFAVADGFAAGADAYMSKPFSPSTLAAQLGALVHAGAYAA